MGLDKFIEKKKDDGFGPCEFCGKPTKRRERPFTSLGNEKLYPVCFNCQQMRKESG